MAKKSAYLKKRKQKNIRFLLTVILIIDLAIAGAIFANRSMDREIESIDRDMTSHSKKLEDINAEIVDLEEDFKIRNTDEFKEKIAKERLGMVREDGSDEQTDGDD